MFTTFILALALGSTAFAQESPPPLPTQTTAHAEEESDSVTVPPRVNRSGIRNQPAVTITVDNVTACPYGYTTSPQFLEADEVATVLVEGANARAWCVTANAEAEAITTSAKAEASATRALGHAGAVAIIMAADRGDATFADAKNGIAATGAAAPLAAVDYSMGGGMGGLSSWALQGANDIALLNLINGGGGGSFFAPPPAPPPPASSPPPKEKGMTPAEATALLNSALGS